MAAVAAGILISRQQRADTPEPERIKDVPAGETVPAEFELDELRRAGF